MMKLHAQLIDEGRATPEGRRFDHFVFGAFDIELEKIDVLAGDELKDAVETGELDLDPSMAQVPLGSNRSRYVVAVRRQKKLRSAGGWPNPHLEEPESVVGEPADVVDGAWRGIEAMNHASVSVDDRLGERGVFPKADVDDHGVGCQQSACDAPPTSRITMEFER
jgi:hypothetical protein